MARPVDIISLEGERGALRIFDSVEVTNDITAPASAIFRIGDDGSYESIYRTIAHGKMQSVFLNGFPRMKGRVVAQEIPDDPRQGTTIELRVSPKFSDAFVSSAEPTIKVEKVSIKDFILKLYEPLEFTEDDFVFAAAAERDLMTGKPSRGGQAPADLEKIKVDQAKVNPPETIYDAATRHLKRHGLMHWDTPDGRIFVGTPDVDQRSIYRFLSKRGARSSGNNVLSIRRTADWFDTPTHVTVLGGTKGKDTAKAKVSATSGHADMLNAGFYRAVILPSEQVKTEAGAIKQARRELSQRSKRKDAYEVTVDGWSYWNGSSATPYAPNTTADVDFDALGGIQGRYYISKVTMREDARNGPVTSIMMTHPDVWRLFGDE